MDLCGHEGEIPMPITSTYIATHEPSNLHYNTSNGPQPQSLIPNDLNNNNNSSIKKSNNVKYRECLKNHAASIGGNATDGCGEFMPNGEEGTLEALKCSACNCHRNFHRKETDDESSCDLYYSFKAKKLMSSSHHTGFGYNNNTSLAPRPGVIMPLGHQYGHSHAVMQTSESDDQMMARPGPVAMKKRFRTKFTPEQKEKMLNFAERVGWKLQKQEESVVQQFCQETGVRRRVLKVWMHNNKHNFAKKVALQLE